MLMDNAAALTSSRYVFISIPSVAFAPFFITQQLTSWPPQDLHEWANVSLGCLPTPVVTILVSQLEQRLTA